RVYGSLVLQIRAARYRDLAFGIADHRCLFGHPGASSPNAAAANDIEPPRFGRAAVNRRWSAAVTAVLVSLAVVTPAFPLLGIPQVVFDPSVYAEAIEQVLQLQKEYDQLIRTYQMIQNQYDHLKWMARRVPVDMAARYRAAVTPWNGSAA